MKTNCGSFRWKTLILVVAGPSVLRKNYRRDLERAKLTNLKEETENKRHPSMMEFCLLWLNLLADLLRFLVLGLRSKSSLAAENLFLRKQLAFYQERKIKPRRTSHPTRLALVWLSRWFNWRSALTVVTPKNLHWLAPQELPAFLASEMPIWPAADSAGAPTSDPRDGSREPLVGRGMNCKRVVAETRPPRVAAHDPEIFAEVAGRTRRQPSPRSAMVNLSQESRRRHHRL
jgi:hypothetical protein